MNTRTLLRILLAISMVYAGLAALSHLTVALMLPTLASYYESHSNLFPAELYTAMEAFFQAPRSFFWVNSMLYVLEVVGAALMWQIRPSGFHCYTLARLLLLLLPPLFLGRGFLGIGDVMFALLYIVTYFLLLRQLGAFGHHIDSGEGTHNHELDNRQPENPEDPQDAVMP